MPTNRQTLINQAAGAALRQQRVSCGLSQESLGKPVGITFQQIQKYESGRNRISLQRLIEMERETGISALAVFQAAREVAHAS